MNVETRRRPIGVFAMVLSGLTVASILFPNAASAQPGVSSGGAFGGGLGGNTVTAGASYVSVPAAGGGAGTTGGGVGAAAGGAAGAGGGAAGPGAGGAAAPPPPAIINQIQQGACLGTPGGCPAPPAVPGVDVPPTPVTLAEVMNVVSSAVSALQVEPIDIGITPQPADSGATGLVGFNSWIWANNPTEAQVGPINRTVTTGVITVNMNAVNTGLAVNYGDGLPTVPPVCPVLAPAYTDAALGLPSPACNHFLQKSSITEPGGTFRPSVTSLWVVTWTAVTPGQAFGGTIPIAPTATTEVRVGEMQVLVTN